jgi:DNA repair protein RecO
MTGLIPSDSVVLKCIDHGERGRIVTLFTAEQGHTSAYARGARGKSKRFGGQLDLFQRGDAVFELRTRSGSLPQLKTFHARFPYEGIRQDVVKFAIASFWAELVLCTTVDADASPIQFERLVAALDSLNRSQESQRRDLVLGFQLLWFDAMGILPPLDEETLSRANVPHLTTQTLAIARALLSGVEIPDLDWERARAVGILTRTLRHQVVNRPLNSAKFLHQMLVD